MDKITLQKRLTHKYAFGWAGLDESEQIGTAREVLSKPRKNHGDTATAFKLLLVNSTADAKDIKQAIYDSLSSGCRCEHDCCGHWQHGVSNVRRIKGGNMYGVFLFAYRNV